MNESETEEISRAISGDKLATERLIESNRKWIRDVAYSFIGNSEDSEDITQNVSMRVLKHIHGLTDASAFRAWLYRIVQHVSMSLGRDRMRRERTFENLSDENLNWVPDRNHAEIENDETNLKIMKAMEELPFRYYRVLKMKHIDEMQYATMAEMTGQSIKCLEVQLVRARKMLGRILNIDLKRGRRRDPARLNFPESR